jgi:hypothetical protein
MNLSTTSRYLVLCLLLLVVVAAPGCAAIAGIFKAGMWVGVLLTVVLVGGVLLVVSRLR